MMVEMRVLLRVVTVFLLWRVADRKMPTRIFSYSKTPVDIVMISGVVPIIRCVRWLFVRRFVAGMRIVRVL